MVTYVLHYFNLPGRAELIRLLFVVAGKSFTDNRLEWTKWPTMKSASSAPWKSLPYLEVDGKLLGQTKAIVRYVANQHGLGGSNDWEKGLVDSVVEATRDILEDLWICQYDVNNNKDDAYKKLVDTTLPTILGSLETFITEHGQNGYIVGGKLTCADLAVYDVIQNLREDKDKTLNTMAGQHENINQVVEKVSADPKIAEYKAKAEMISASKNIVIPNEHLCFS